MRSMNSLRLGMLTIASAALLGNPARGVAQVRSARAPESYLLWGVVRDSASGQPVANAQLWPFLQRYGAVTDSAGYYRLRWDGGPATETIIVRICNGANLATVRVEFVGGNVERDVIVRAPRDQRCAPTDR